MIRLSALVLLFVLLGGCAQSTSTPQAIHIRPAQGTESSVIVDEDLAIDGMMDEFADFEEEFDTDDAAPRDPLEKWNRGVFAFNNKAYDWILRPATRAYRAVTPEPVRLGTRNFFRNLAMPVRAINCLLQGKFKAAGTEVARFGVNTVVGIFGCADPAADAFGWKPQDEDLGQTLAVWGLGEGPYLVWPLMGPGNVRDFGARAGDYFLMPLTYVDAWKLELALKGVEATNVASFTIENYDTIMEDAVEPYIVMREGYRQYRRQEIEE